MDNRAVKNFVNNMKPYQVIEILERLRADIKKENKTDILSHIWTLASHLMEWTSIEASGLHSLLRDCIDNVKGKEYDISAGIAIKIIQSQVSIAICKLIDGYLSTNYEELMRQSLKEKMGDLY